MDITREMVIFLKWKFFHIFYSQWWSLEDYFLKQLIFYVIPLNFPLWPSEKTSLQVSFGIPYLFNIILFAYHSHKLQCRCSLGSSCNLPERLHNEAKGPHTEIIRKKASSNLLFHHKQLLHVTKRHVKVPFWCACTVQTNKSSQEGVKNMHFKYLYWTAKCSMLAKL